MRDLGDKNHLILRNHGLLTCGATVADTFLSLYVLQRACEIQVRAQAGGGELIPVPQAIVDGIRAQREVVTRGAGAMVAWPAVLRRLDRRDPSWRE